MWPIVCTGLNIILILVPLIVLAVFLVKLRRRNQDKDRLPLYRTMKIRYNLTARVELEAGSLRAAGEERSFWDRVEVNYDTYGDPADLALHAAKASKEEVELVVDRNGIRFTTEDGLLRLPRSALKSVACASRMGGRRKSRGQSSSALHVCLCFDDARLGNIAVGVFVFTVGVPMLLGKQTQNFNRDAVDRADTLAHSISECLEIPVQPNHYRGLLAGFEIFLRG